MSSQSDISPGAAPLRILHLEDNVYDRELIAIALRRGGLDCEFVYVADETGFRNALGQFPFDLILSDFTLPSFSGPAGFRLASGLRPEIPFIYVSGTIGEERAVESLKSGATDYVLKDHLGRLADVIRRALREAREREERKTMEEALRVSEQRFRELAETIEDVFWITDLRKNQMFYVSPAYERIWGKSRQSLYDEPASWLDAIHTDDRERVRHASITRQTAGTYDEEYRIVRPDGKVRWIRDRAYPVPGPGGHTGRIVGVARDITERRELEEQLRQAQKMEAIGQVAGGVAHDFNNILAAIMMWAEAAETGHRTAAETKSDMQQIRSACERAASLIRQLLLFSRRQTMQPKVLNLNESVSSLSRMLRRVIGEQIQSELRLHGAPLMVHADPGMLDQVLLNLAVNARDAMPEGGRLLIETGEQIVDDPWARLHPGFKPGRYIRLTVSDSGTGIAPEILPRIFEPFFTTKAPGKGTGLGLATVFGIVKQHGGLIEVQSQPGQGATFRVLLPASSAVATSTTAAVRPQASLRGTEVILLVEDEPSVRFVTRAILERFGYRVLEAASGPDAIKIWEEQKQSIALLLTDLVLPGGFSGLQLAEQFRKDKPGIVVIYASGYSAEVAGASSNLRRDENFVQKPFRPDHLLEMIRRSLDETARKEGSA